MISCHDKNLISIITINMTWLGITNVTVILTFLSCSVLDAIDAMECDVTKPPVKEMAYKAPYEIVFPDRAKTSQTCSWLITAYRDHHVLQLRFGDVITTRAANGTCVDDISVYDGMNTRSPVLASVCSLDALDVHTSTKHALVVVILGSAHLSLNSIPAQFFLRYSSMEQREDGNQRVWILSFVAIVGLMCCVGFCCGLLKCLVQYRSSRLASRSTTAASSSSSSSSSAAATATTNVDSGGGGGGGEGDNDGDDDRGGVGGGGVTAEVKNMSISERVWKLLERMFQEKNWWNTTRTHGNNTSSSNRHSRRNQHRHNNHHQQQQQRRQPNQHQLQQHQRRRQQRLVHQPRSDAVVSSLDLDITDSSGAQTSRDEFCFQDIPVTSFTSDPSEVKPPAYEECLKNTNPLYLYYHRDGAESVAFYNRAFDVKDGQEPISAPETDSLTPPPPYTEITSNSNTNDTTAERITTTTLNNDDTNHRNTICVNTADVSLTSSSLSSSLSSTSGLVDTLRKDTAPRRSPRDNNDSQSNNTTRFYRDNPENNNSNNNNSNIHNENINFEFPLDPPPPFSDGDYIPDEPPTIPPAQSSSASSRNQTSLTSSTTMAIHYEKDGRDDANDVETDEHHHCQQTSKSSYPSNKNITRAISKRQMFSTARLSSNSVRDDSTTSNNTTHYNSQSSGVNETIDNTKCQSSTVAAAPVPYAMMRRSGLITTLSDQQDGRDTVTPVEDCFDTVANSSTTGLHLNHILDNMEGAMAEGGGGEEKEVDKEDRGEENSRR